MAKIKKESPRKSANLTGIKLDDRMRLTTKGGKSLYMTIREALLPHNFNKLSSSSQKALTSGTSATKIVADIEKSRGNVVDEPVSNDSASGEDSTGNS